MSFYLAVFVRAFALVAAIVPAMWCVAVVIAHFGWFTLMLVLCTGLGALVYNIFGTVLDEMRRNEQLDVVELEIPVHHFTNKE